MNKHFLLNNWHQEKLFYFARASHYLPSKQWTIQSGLDDDLYNNICLWIYSHLRRAWQFCGFEMLKWYILCLSKNNNFRARKKFHKKFCAMPSSKEPIYRVHFIVVSPPHRHRLLDYRALLLFPHNSVARLSVSYVNFVLRACTIHTRRKT